MSVTTKRLSSYPPAHGLLRPALHALRTVGAAAFLFCCVVSLPFVLFSPPRGAVARAAGATVPRAADVPAFCQVKPENMNLEDQSRMGVQLSFRKGRPFLKADDAAPSLSSKFCSGPGCAGAAPGAKAILIQRLNVSLADLPYPDLIASAPLFQVMDRPKEPDDDATEKEKAQYRGDLEKYKRQVPDPPDPPADDATEAEKQAYKNALEAFNKRQEGIDKLITALHAKIAKLPATREARTYNGGWDGFFNDADGHFEKWRAAVLNSAEVRAAFDQLWQAVDGKPHEFAVETSGITVLRFFTGEPIRTPLPGEEGQRKSLFPDLLNSPLIIIRNGVEPGIPSYSSGRLCFRFTDAIDLGDGRERQPNFTIAPAEAAHIVISAMRRYGLEGVPWSAEAVQPAVNSYYLERGYVVKVQAGSQLAGAVGGPIPRFVNVLRQRINSIRISNVTDEEALRVLQTMLPASSFEELVRNDLSKKTPKYLTPEQTGDVRQVVLTICAEKGKCEGEDPKPLDVPDEFRFIDSFRRNRIDGALKDIHYVIAGETPGSDDTVAGVVPLTLTVVKDDKEDGSKQTLPTPTPTPTPTPEASPASGHGAAGVEAEAATPTPTPTPSPTPEKSRGAFDDFLKATLFQVCPRHNNLFYGGVLLRPGQGARAVGGYKCLKAGPGAAGFTAGEDGGAIGSLSYSAVVPFFGTGPFGARRRPLAIAFEASTLFERSRLINGEKFDERRQGGVLRFVLPLRSPSDGMQFDLAAEARRQTVSLLQGERTVAKQNLTTLDFGARLYRDARHAARPHYWELTPHLKLGLGLADGESSFALFSATAAAHGALGYALDYDLKGRVAAASADTPFFERPSFGAPDTVRGFRTDDAIGLRMWTVQPELWLRGRGLLAPKVNPLTGEEGRLRAAFRESLSLAAFYDVGGVYKTLNSPPGVRGGPGFGLRFNYGQRAYFKFDWAYGLGDRASGRHRLRFYFTLDLPENPL
ncbi:MAG: BamA/TamA family outer membrane protein [Acidobacteria bacterium]|nr:BamA/TamA family outer membrane protein [Acidobacteriota bacterium]